MKKVFKISFIFLCSILLFINPTIGEANSNKYPSLLQDAQKKVKLLNASGVVLANQISIPYLKKKYLKNPYVPVSASILKDTKTKLSSATSAVGKLTKKDQSKYVKSLTSAKTTISKAETFTKIIRNGNQFLSEFNSYSKKYELDPLNRNLNSIYLSLDKKQYDLLKLINGYSVKGDIPFFLEKYDQSVSLVVMDPKLEQERVEAEKKQQEELAKQKEQEEKIQSVITMKETSEKERLALLATKYTKTMITNRDLLNLIPQQTESKDSISWYGYELQDINLYFTKEALQSHIYLLDYAQPIINEVRKYMGVNLHNRINVFIYDGERMRGTGNQYRIKGDYVFLNVTDNDGSMVWDERPVFAHEMAHAFQQHRWKFERLYPVFKVETYDAVWLAEGMAEYVARHVIQYKPLEYPRNLFLRFTNFDHLSFPLLLDHYENRSNIDLSTIQSWPSSFWASDDYIAYESFIYFLEKQYGHEAFMNWIDYAISINNLEEATLKFFGKTSKEIAMDWQLYYKIGHSVTGAAQIYIVDFMYREDPLVSQLPYLSTSFHYGIVLRDYLPNSLFPDLINKARDWEITLTNPDKPSLKAHIDDGFWIHNNQVLQLFLPDYAAMENGVPYKLKIEGTGEVKVNIPDDFYIVKP